VKEPTVRIRCEADEEAAARQALARSGFAPERSLGWLVVRDADPDEVNEALAAGGARSRVVVREGIGKIVGFVLDRGGQLDGRGPSLAAQVRRVLDEGGLAARYAPRPEPELLDAARRLHEHLMATGAGFVSWETFVGLFCAARAG
jgi:hypothetical protein